MWVVRRLWGLVLRLHRRRRRRLRRRGHGRARRLTVRAAATVMPCLIGIVDAVAVLRAVYHAHVVVAHATRVLAVFIITRAAAVLHRFSYPDSAVALLVWAPLGVVLRTARCEEWTSAAMEDECGSQAPHGVRRPVLVAAQQNRASVERHTSLKKPLRTVDVVA